MKSKLTKQIKYNPDKRKPYSYRIFVGKNELTGAYMHRQKSFKTFDEALESLVKLKKSLEDGTFQTTTKRYKYSDLVKLWLPQYKQTVKQSTYATVSQAIDNHILPSLGKFYLDKLSVVKCQKVVNDWFADYPGSYNRLYAYARKILEYGIHLEIINSNPMSKIIKPRAKKEAKVFTNYYSKEELTKFLESCKKYGQPLYYTYFRLLAYTGLRPSEALALKWSDINFFKSTLSVNRTVDTKEHNKVVIDAPKTVNSIRTIDIDPSTVNLLRTWHRKNNTKVVTLNNGDGYVFYNPKRSEGVFVRQDASRWDAEICDAYNLRHISPHGFRHTHASMLFSAGAKPKEVQERLGHSTIKTTMDMYVHLSQADKKQTVAKFANYMKAE